MPSIKSLAAFAPLALGLAACAGQPHAPLSATNNPSVNSVHQPIVQRTDFVIDLTAGPDGLAPGERQRLAAWFRSIELRYGDRLYVDEPVGRPAPGARADVQSLLSEHGLYLLDDVPITPGPVQPGTIRFIASRATASVPGCPNWDNHEELPNVSTSSNFGCAVNQDIAMMVADPNDLVFGRAGNNDDSADTAYRAIHVYRSAQPTGTHGLQSVSTGGAGGSSGSSGGSSGGN